VRQQGENREHVISLPQVQKLCKPIATLHVHFYHNIFVTELNIYFGYPRSDTCDTCDSRIEVIEMEQDKFRDHWDHLRKLYMERSKDLDNQPLDFVGALWFNLGKVKG